MTFTIANDEGIAAVEAFLAENSYLSGGNAPGTEDAALLGEMETAKFIPTSATSPNLFGWWWTLAPFRANARALWGQTKGGKAKGAKKAAPAKVEKKAEAKPAANDDDDDSSDDDCFGSDDEDDAAAIEAMKAKAAAKKKKSKKHPRKDQAKSILEFDVKGYEMDQDWNAMATGIRAVEMNGVTWMNAHEIVPIAFGMKKLRMKCIIVDDLVQTDDVFEKIQELYEDDVQSVDTVSFNKA
jgi:translation elongation factor EF-1beta